MGQIIYVDLLFYVGHNIIYVGHLLFVMWTILHEHGFHFRARRTGVTSHSDLRIPGIYRRGILSTYPAGKYWSPRMSLSNFPRTSRKDLFDHPGDIPTWRPNLTS